MGESSTNISIKGYEVLEASGSQIKARHVNLDRVVSLRVVEDSADPEVIEQFLSVARTVAKIQHPNIIQVSDAGTCPDSGVHYMAMEFIGDQTLERVLEEEGGPIGESDALAVTQAVAEALICLEDNGIAHGDLRPENILIDNDGTPKLSEVGFALRADPSDLDRHRYMAPEQFASGKPSNQSDLYSLGCTLYRMLSGKAPYSGETRDELADSHTNGPFPSLEADDASAELIEAMLGMVAIDPKKRYGGALKANLDLVRVMTGHPPDGPSGNPRARGSNTETFNALRLEEGKTPPEGDGRAGPVFRVKVSSRNVVLSEYEFDKDVVTIGRGAGCDVHIDNPIVSRKHAQLVRKHGGVQIEALSSTNATAVDGQRLKLNGPRALMPGGTVIISDKFHLELDWTDDADPRDAYSAIADDDTPVVGTRRPDPEGASPTPAVTPAPAPAPQPQAGDEPTPVVGTRRAQAEQAASDYAAQNGGDEDAYASPSYTDPATEPYAPPSPYLSGADGVAGAEPVTDVAVSRSSDAPDEFTQSGLRKIFAPPQGYLMFARSGRQVRSFVDKGFQIGASSACDMRLPKGSPRKAALIVRGVDTYRLYNVAPAIDMVTLNDEPVPDRAVLEDGDVISVCGVNLHFALGTN